MCIRDRTCSTCGVGYFEPEKWFRKCRRNKDGFQSQCKSCEAHTKQAWYYANRERQASLTKAWRDANKEREAATKKAYRAKNRDRVNEYSLARYHRMGGDGYRRHLALILEMDGPCCGDNPIGGLKGCGIDLTTLPREQINVDHILPVAKGGTNDLDNLQALCRSCNIAAGDKTVDEFAKELW